MILLDCGNSSLKAQFWRDGFLQGSFAGSYGPRWLQRVDRWMQNLPASRCYLASVLDTSRQEELDRCLASRFDSAVTRFVSQASSLGISNAYRNPAALGVDRWLALLAAPEISERDCFIIDAGSAITLDLLRADGQHLGGAILPGLNTSLSRFRQIFQHIDFDHADIARTAEPGCSTEAGIQIDYEHSSIEHLTALVNRWSHHLETDATVLIAGGDGSRVLGELDRPGRIVPDLVFRGMRRLALS